MNNAQSISANFRYVAFVDLLADSAYQHRLATEACEVFADLRHSRASIVASALSIECVANRLLDLVNVPKLLLKDLDKLSPLSKIETALRILGRPGFDRGRNEVQKVAELFQARNDFVHAKSSSQSVEMYPPQDADTEWMFPFTLAPDTRESLEIPKLAMFWSSEASHNVLSAVSLFLRYIFVDVMQADAADLQKLLLYRVEIKGLLMPAVADELKREIAWLRTTGIDFSFIEFLTRGA